MGPEAYLHFGVKAAPVAPMQAGEQAGSGGPSETTFVARVGARTRADEGERLDLLVDTSVLHVFDRETGDRISH
jgi:multiple sugar transport system ATP-binding protein